MIRHIVLLDLSQDHDAGALARVMDGLDRLRSAIPGYVGFAHGPNRDFEAMSPHCAYAFTCDFADEATSHAYIANEAHRALGAQLVAMCRGGAKGITVVDMAVSA